MKHKTQKILGAVALSLVLGSTAANAAPVTVNWSGEVTSSVISGSVDVGDAITGSFTYDEDNLFGASIPSTFSEEHQTGHISSFSIVSSSSGFILSGFTAANAITVTDNDNSAGFPIDKIVSSAKNPFSSGPYSGDILGGKLVRTVHITLYNGDGTVFSSTDLPSALELDPGKFISSASKGALRLEDFAGNYDGNVSFSIDSFTTNVAPVPVPAAVWLMGSALAGLMGFKRKKVA